MRETGREEKKKTFVSKGKINVFFNIISSVPSTGQHTTH
jgi:hypothetical protein